MLVAYDLVYLLMVIPFRSLLVPVVILFALPLAVIGAFVVLAVIDHATNIITSLAVSLQPAATVSCCCRPQAPWQRSPPRVMTATTWA